MNRSLLLSARFWTIGLLAACQSPVFAGGRHGDPSESPQEVSKERPKEELGTPAFETAKKRIQRMVDIVDGRLAQPAAKTDKNELPFLAPRETLAATLVKKLMKSLDNGTVQDTLRSILTENESYTEIESGEVFEFDGTKPLDALTKKEKVKAAAAYTKARKELRAKLLDEVAKMLRKEADPRAKLVARAVEITRKESQKAYDVALEKIQSENLEHAICLTCSEEVAPKNPTNPEDKDYDFYGRMESAAEKAVASVTGLAPASPREPTSPVRFSPSGNLYTGNGSEIHDLNSGSTQKVGVNKAGNWLYNNENLNVAVPHQREALDLALDVKNRPLTKAVSSNPAGTGLGALGKVNAVAPAVASGNAESGFVFSGNEGYEKAYKLALENEKPLAIYVGATWCSACTTMKKDTLEPMKAENGGRIKDSYFVELDIDADKALAAQLMEGRTLPQTVVFAKAPNGEFKRFSLQGPQSEPRVKALVQKALDALKPK
jgi:thiol-disulfide isomerase/thioredoxin